MARNTLEHRTRHHTEDAADQEDDYDTKVEILTRYTEKLAESHPELLRDLSALQHHHGRDQTDWNAKFQEPDAGARYSHAFRLATDGMNEHERHYAASETAATLSYPTQSRMEDLRTEVTYYKADDPTSDKLDPTSHRSLLHLNAIHATDMLYHCHRDLTQALMETDRQQVQSALHNLAYTSHMADRAHEGYLPSNTDGVLAERIEQVAHHRRDLLDARFNEYLADHNQTANDPSEPDFQEAFREFSKDYRSGDTERLALHYAQQQEGHYLFQQVYWALTQQTRMTGSTSKGHSE